LYIVWNASVMLPFDCSQGELDSFYLSEASNRAPHNMFLFIDIFICIRISSSTKSSSSKSSSSCVTVVAASAVVLCICVDSVIGSCSC
jgi:hypothetical protein